MQTGSDFGGDEPKAAGKDDGGSYRRRMSLVSLRNGSIAGRWNETLQRACVGLTKDLDSMYSVRVEHSLV
jgi:hypothetical protein